VKRYTYLKVLTKSFENKWSSFSCFCEKKNFWSLHVFFCECFMIHLSYFDWFITDKFSYFFSQIFFVKCFTKIMILNWNWEWRICSNSWIWFDTFFCANLLPFTTIDSTDSKNTFVLICKFIELIFNLRFRFTIIRFIEMYNTGSTISFAGDLSIEIKLGIINNIWRLHIIEWIVLFFSFFTCGSNT